MFDKHFVQDERVLLHQWDLLHARFMFLARSGQMVLRGAWEMPRLRDVLVNAADELLAVERELARFHSSPAGSLAPAEAALWRAASDWVGALREWSIPPETWTAGQLSAALARRQLLEAQLMATIAAHPFGGDESESDAADPMITR